MNVAISELVVEYLQNVRKLTIQEIATYAGVSVEHITEGNILKLDHLKSLAERLGITNMPITSLLTQALESGKPELWQKILESAAPQEISHALVEIFKKETGYTQRIEHVITTFAKLEVTTRGTSTHTQVVRFLRLAEEARTSQTSVSELILELAKFSFIEQPGVL